VNILGINAYHASASAALVCDGRLVAAAEEERFNRVKYAAGFPGRAIGYCLKCAGLTVADLDYIAVARDPWARIGRKFFHAIRLPAFARERAKAWSASANIPEALAALFETDAKPIRAKFHRVEHHRAHLASAFFVSPFEQAAVLSADGLGDFASTMWAIGEGNRMQIRGTIAFPHSLGIYYTALSQYLGFWNFGDEYKVMGLAAYGEPMYLDEFRRILIADGVRFRLALEYFTHSRHGVEMTWQDAANSPMVGRLFSQYLEERLGRARGSNDPLEQKHKNVAASLQARLEEVLVQLIMSLRKQSRSNALCLAGGVAFNCVANGKLARQAPFESIFVQPAAGDAGLAVGAAFYLWHEVLGQSRRFEMRHAFWGPEYSPAEIKMAIAAHNLYEDGFAVKEENEDRLAQLAARAIADGKVVGWFSGRAEWGPRSLGNRSILADPRRAGMSDILNRRIKHRESFRPFAPSILAERSAEFFGSSKPSPFMTVAYALRPEKRDLLPAATHVDGTCRLQTVDRDTNPRFWKLIQEFAKLTGVPAVVNTSFNDNEPMVCSPSEAIDCFQRTHMDMLVMGNIMIRKPGSPIDKASLEPGSRHISEVSR